MKMTLDESHIMQISDIHDAALIERGLHPDNASISYLDKFAQQIESNPEVEGVVEKEQLIKNEVIKEMENLLGDYIFAAFIHKLVSNPDELFIYKKQFTSYIGAQSFFSLILGIDHKDLSSFMFCKRTGKVYYSKNILPSLSWEKKPPSEGRVSFRLTPNLQYFMTPIGIEGPFAGVISAAAMVFEMKKLNYFYGYLSIFYRDLFSNIPESMRGKEIERSLEFTKINLLSLLDSKVIGKLFKSRHDVFKTETVKITGPEEKKEDPNEKPYWTSINQKVYNKIIEAKDPILLSGMPLEWAPWF